jgi:phosphoribosyl 1,2-cyclic phosphodiesterase
VSHAFSVRALASGSSGNATLVRSAEAVFLIDAGLGIRRLVPALRDCGVSPSDLCGIVVTHEHNDHAVGACPLSRKYGVPIVANVRTLTAVFRQQRETPSVPLDTGARWCTGDMLVETFPIPHDAAEPVGVNVIHGPSGQKVSHLTDLGHVTDTVRHAIRGANLLVLEANHDVHRLLNGRYPGMLKARILSDRGHLSNEEAVKLLCEHALAHGPFTVWLAHLSKENNTPRLALNYARATVSVETNCPVVFDVARRDKPSAQWSPGDRALQLKLF